MERMEKRKLGETFRARVSDNPNALVKPKILGTETLGVRGQPNPFWKVWERQGYARISLEIDIKFEFWAYPEIWTSSIKIYEVHGGIQCTG